MSLLGTTTFHRNLLEVIHIRDHTSLSDPFAFSSKMEYFGLICPVKAFSFPKGQSLYMSLKEFKAAPLTSGISTYIAQCSGVKGLPINLRKHFCSKSTSIQFSLPARKQRNLGSLQERNFVQHNFLFCH